MWSNVKEFTGYLMCYCKEKLRTLEVITNRKSGRCKNGTDTLTMTGVAMVMTHYFL